MKLVSILSLVLYLATFSAYGQVIVLEVKNPFPRVGNECEVEYTIRSDTFKVSDDLGFFERMKVIQAKELGKGTMKFTNLIKDTGYTSFGPFTFIVGEKIMTSDKITLHFDSPLPVEKAGIWIRQKSYLGQEYLIIEQRISGEWVTTRTSDSSMSSEFQQESNEFIEINKEKIDTKYIKFDFSNSTSKSQELEINGKIETVGYKISVYRMTKTDLFKTGFKLDSNNLKFLLGKQTDFKFYVQ